jgi:hypothetical protein
VSFDWVRHFSNGRNALCTAVDSTFQVLLCLVRDGTFWQSSKVELLSSPFRATVRVGDECFY